MSGIFIQIKPEFTRHERHLGLKKTPMKNVYFLWTKGKGQHRLRMQQGSIWYDKKIKAEAAQIRRG